MPSCLRLAQEHDSPAQTAHFTHLKLRNSSGLVYKNNCIFWEIIYPHLPHSRTGSKISQAASSASRKSPAAIYHIQWQPLPCQNRLSQHNPHDAAAMSIIWRKNRDVFLHYIFFPVLCQVFKNNKSFPNWPPNIMNNVDRRQNSPLFSVFYVWIKLLSGSQK